jgi:hypothetical protein
MDDKQLKNISTEYRQKLKPELTGIDRMNRMNRIKALVST